MLLLLHFALEELREQGTIYPWNLQLQNREQSARRALLYTSYVHVIVHVSDCIAIECDP